MSLTLTRRHNVDRFGYLIPHRYGNLPMVGAVATYRPGEGRFGGAVAVEEGTTNLHKDPLNPARTTHASAIAKELYETDTPFGFRQVAKLDGPGDGVFIAWPPGLTLDPNQPVTVSVWLRTLEGELRTPLMYLGNAYRTADNTYKGVGEWTQITKTFQPDQFTSSATFHFYKGSPGPVEVCAVQVEQKPFATSFVDGTRADGILAYPVNLPDEHSIVCWRKSPTDTEYHHIVKHSDGTVFVDGEEDSDYDVGWIAGRNLVLDSATEHIFINTVFSNPLRADVFHKMIGEQLTLSFYAKAEAAGQRMDCYLRDVSAQAIVGGYWGPIEISTEYTRYSYTIVLEDISAVNNLSFAFRNTVAAGGSVRGAVSVKNIKIEKGSTTTDWTPAPEDLGYSDDCLMFSNQTGLIDELLVLPYAASEEEIASWYEAQGPLPPHPQALLQWDRQTVRPAQMVKL